ncbi:MAG: MmcQ/YjbR family DNA-binding protein [Halanaerobiales bacterium]|nr:MmcQ/YjbR family DNA-binding protein [Halanaerobiales bacterium]
MDIEKIREYFLSKPGVVEEQPFNQPVPVFKVGGKMFSLINIHEPDRTSINLKHYKEENYELREVYDEIVPGYHMNKAHWNTVYLDGNLEEEFVKCLIATSYDLVFKSLSKSKQKEILVTNQEV